MSGNRHLKQGRTQEEKPTQTLRATARRTKRVRGEELSPEQRLELAEQIEATESRGKPPSI
jgi:hypothetical protein